VKSSDALATEYRQALPVAERMAARLREQLSNLFDENEITLGVPLEIRIKEFSSIENKIERKNLSLNSIYELGDLVGVRSILLFERDAYKSSSLIEDKFDIVEKVIGDSRLDINQFGYNSDHYIIKIPKNWLEVPSFRGLGILKAEIQVRTMAQHIWAAASHKLQYKREESVPVPLRRAISRVSALLETVDIEFSRVLKERDDYIQSLADISEEKILDVDLVSSILDVVLPQSNKYEDEDYDQLIVHLNKSGIFTRRDLEEFLSKDYIDKAISEDKAQVRNIIRDGADDEDEENRARQGVYFTHVGLVRIALQHMEKDNANIAP